MRKEKTSLFAEGQALEGASREEIGHRNSHDLRKTIEFLILVIIISKTAMTLRPHLDSRFLGLLLAWFLNFIIIFCVISAICQCYRWIFFTRPVSPILHHETVYYQHPPHFIPSDSAVYQIRECSPKIDSTPATNVYKPVSNTIPPTTVSTKPVTMTDMDDFC